MANEYLYGAYGHIGETVAQSAVQAGTTPVYIGTAPVNLVRDFGKAGIINAPIKITSLVDAQKKIGYSSDWGTFTLCEAVYAHFNNTLGNIGPIYVINVLDPSAGKHRKETATTKTLTFTGGRAEFASDKIILDTLTIAKNDSGNYVEGTDYAVDYNFTKGTVIITSLKDDAQLAGSLTASFSEVDDSEIADSDIIGGVTSSGEYQRPERDRAALSRAVRGLQSDRGPRLESQPCCLQRHADDLQEDQRPLGRLRRGRPAPRGQHRAGGRHDHQGDRMEEGQRLHRRAL